MQVEDVTSWNLPRILLSLIPEAAPALAQLAVDAYEIDPDALDLPEDEMRRLKPGYPKDSEGSMSLIELTEAYEPSARTSALDATLGARFRSALTPYSVMSEFKHTILVPALRSPTNTDLINRSCQFLEAALGGQQYVSEAVRLQVLEGAGIEDYMVPHLLASAGPLLTDALRRYGYPVE